jgi:RNA polymerase sigma-70 factor (ECF subfamily)
VTQRIHEIEDSPEEQMITTELEDKIRKAIDKLPPKRREIFILSRYHGLKYDSIAQQMGISSKTVENQMVKALKFLRGELREYLPLVILILGKIM